MSELEGIAAPGDGHTLARVLSRSASLVQARACGVLLWDEEKNDLTSVIPFAGFEDEEIRQFGFKVPNSVLGGVVTGDRPILLDELTGSQPDIEFLKKLNVQNLVAVPLALERRVEEQDTVERSIMGVILAVDRYYGRSFDREDARILNMMARSASAVLVTSQLYWKEAERRRRVVRTIESMAVGLIAVTPNGTVQQINAAARKALKVKTEDWFGLPYQEVIRSEEIKAICEAALASDPVKRTEVTLPGYEGDERVYRVQSDSIASEKGGLLGWVIVLEDVTDIRQSEKMMAVFVDMVSHELRTPLTSIRGFVATLLQAEKGTFDYDTEQEFLQIVDTEAERLGQMIDDLLNIARIQNGRGLQFNFTSCEIREIVERVVRLQEAYKNANQELVVDIPDDTPPVVCDNSKITQALTNILGNALKYSPEGGKVRLWVEQKDGGLVFSISDEGIGIPPDQLPKMFSHFFRVDSPESKSIKGTGLGLWLTKHLIDGHGGRIWVESEYRKGSTFRFWLPLDANEALAAEEPPGGLGSGTERTRG